MEPIVLIGGGGHCISSIDVLRLAGVYEIVGILDTYDKIGTTVSGITVIGSDEDIPLFAGKYKNFLISIGQIKSPEKRLRIFELIKNFNGILPVIFSPRAYISPSSKIGEGSIIMHNATVNANTVIGRNCIINTGALLEHEVSIGDNCHISTHAVVNGQVSIGSNSFLGSNSVIANNITLPSGIIVGAGACVFKSPGQSGIYIGNPAKKTLKS